MLHRVGATPLRYKSETKTHSADAELEFKNWVPPRGPNGGRVCIDYFLAVANFSQVDNATTAIQGEDRARFFQRLHVYDKSGFNRWGLRGDASRTFGFSLLGADSQVDHADIASSASDVDVPTTQIVPMSKPFAKRPRDFALAADSFDKFVIQAANLAEVNVSGGSITVDTGTYYVIACCHEEFSVELKARDQVKDTLFGSTTEQIIHVAGRLQDLSLYARGASGGASLANLTNVRIEGIRNEALDRLEALVPMYQAERGQANNLASTPGTSIDNDPHVNNAACPVLWSNRERVYDGALVDQAKIQLTNSVASVIALHRAVLPRSPDLDAHVARLYRKNPVTSFRYKTAGKTKRPREAWDKHPDRAIFMPMSAAL